MILLGQYDSSFVRRVGIALRLYGLPFEHRPWSVVSDFERLSELNPLGRVPVLVLDGGEVLTETSAILDHLDRLVPPDRALCPRDGDGRRQVLRVMALASGLMDKGIAAFYERAFHPAASGPWLDRCRRQIAATLARLEAERRETGEFWVGGRLSHADIAVAAVLRHLCDSVPDLCEMGRLPALADHAARLEATEVFREISQPFVPPA